jgi:hypothetical protein
MFYAEGSTCSDTAPADDGARIKPQVFVNVSKEVVSLCHKADITSKFKSTFEPYPRDVFTAAFHDESWIRLTSSIALTDAELLSGETFLPLIENGQPLFEIYDEHALKVRDLVRIFPITVDEARSRMEERWFDKLGLYLGTEADVVALPKDGFICLQHHDGHSWKWPTNLVVRCAKIGAHRRPLAFKVGGLVRIKELTVRQASALMVGFGGWGEGHEGTVRTSKLGHCFPIQGVDVGTFKAITVAGFNWNPRMIESAPPGSKDESPRKNPYGAPAQAE